VDGISTVMRTIPSLADKPQDGNHAQEQEAKRRRAGGLKENQAPLAAH
jgi:hypothetical protein